MKKTIHNAFKFLFVSLLIIVLAACNNDTKDGDENKESGPVTINLAMFEADANGMMEKARKQFNEEHENIKLEFTKMSNDGSQMHDQTVTQLASGSKNLDIVNLDVVWTAEFAEADWLLPLSDQFDSDMQSEFIQRQIDAVTYNDEIWAVPWFNDLHPLNYREDLLEKYDLELPNTYQEAIEVIKTIQKEEDIQGFSMHWGRSEQLIVSFVEFLHANNAEFFNENNEVVINSPEAVEALQFMVDMIYEHKVVSESSIGNTTPEDARIPFTQGSALFNPNWSYIYSVNQADDSPVKDKTWVSSGFAFDGGQKSSAVGGWNFAISKHSPNPEEAFEVIKWLTSFDVQKMILEGGGFVGTQTALYEDEEILEELPQLAAYLNVFDDAANRPTHPNYAELSDVSQSYIHKALTQELTPKEALDGLAEALKEF